MLKGGDKTESFADVLVPRFSVARFIVKDDVTTNVAKWGGTKVKRAIEIFPLRDAGVGVA